ncbi:MAG TPA: hypothetical protein VIT89_02755 [Solirubrobacterales bacterium]
MAERRSIAAGKHGGVASPVFGEVGVSHGVDPAVDSAQTVRLEGAGYVALGKSQLPQLLERDDAVLNFSQLG